ncbi:MAG: preprotein translocase subunit YajC [Myxococcota bacterium]
MDWSNWVSAEGPLSMIFLVTAMMAVLYFVLIRPQSKQRQQHQQLIESLKKGDEVVLSCGIAGRVYAVQDRFVLLEIAERVRIRAVREAIQVRTNNNNAPAVQSKTAKQQAVPKGKS